MALIFGRFDKADESVREALLELARAVKVKEGEGYGTADKLNFHEAAYSLFQYALEREPDVTITDLCNAIVSLGREAKQTGHLGPYYQPYVGQVRFKFFYHPGRKNGGTPPDGEPSMTLAEMAIEIAVINAVSKRIQGDVR